MAKQYRKKPVVIEAVQFLDNPERLCELSEFITTQDLRVNYEDPENPVLKIETLEGIMNASVGEYYPCKPDIFEKTYEEVGR
jgi:hypothetical protein